MDVLDVLEKCSAAVSLARSLNTPTLIEAKTYRYRGHSMSDPDQYRTKEEIDREKRNDPILMLKADLLDRGFDAPKLDAIDKAAKKEAADSVEFAAKSPYPDVSELATDIYAKPWDEKLLPRVTVG
jgi:pyruvate dehydrogenase E1 component alpha subunit